MTAPIYPAVTVQLTGQDGNAFGIIASVQKALRRSGIPAAEVSAFVNEATEGDYGHVLRTCNKWVNIE